MDNTQYCKCGVVVYSYADNHCSNCGAFINEDGTTGKSYAELEAELAEAKRMAAWYLLIIEEKEIETCGLCRHSFTSASSEPCKSCKYSYDHNSKDNFTPAPVPADFEVKENG